MGGVTLPFPPICGRFSLKTVIYHTTTQINCPCNSNILIGVTTTLTPELSPVIPGHVVSVTTTVNSCLQTVYHYVLQYDENDLADPGYSLLSSDINCAICRDCLTAYIEYLSSIVDGIDECVEPIVT